MTNSSENQIERRFATRLDICDRLLETVWAERPSRAEATDEAQAVLMAILRRSIDSFDAATHLCRAGLSVPALMIVRSLFEDMVSAFWLCVPEKREVALQNIRDQDDHLVLLTNDVIRANPHRYTIPPDDHPDLEARRREFGKTFGRYGSKTWVGQLHSAVQDIKPLWASLGGDTETLSIHHDVVHRHANLHLHGTIAGIKKGLKTYDIRNGRALDAQEARDIDLVLRASYMCLERLAQLVATEFGHDVSKLDALTTEANHIFLAKPPPSGRKPGRNDPCWCGSGKKSKRCHGG